MQPSSYTKVYLLCMQVILMRTRSVALLVLLLIVGSVLGSALWQLLDPILPAALSRSFSIGTTGGPLQVDLNFVVLTLGFVLKVNIGAALGMAAALFFYFRR